MNIDYSGWQFYADLVQLYHDDYYKYDIGRCAVDVDDIVGLSNGGVLREEKLQALYKSISREGYKYEGNSYMDLNLVSFPDGTYSVCEGGNHRPYVAKQLGIDEILAYVSVLIPKEMLTATQIELCESIEIGDFRNPILEKICRDLQLLPKQKLIRSVRQFPKQKKLKINVRK